jgi:NAD-dependent dihydropyrimidine dehydrogenase PreA subunit
MAVVVDLGKCTGCGDCIEACPMDALKVENEKCIVDDDNCGDCGVCVDECSDAAITLPE